LFKKTELGEVYADTTQLIAQGFAGNRSIKHSFLYRFKTLEALEKHVASFFEMLEKREAMKAGWKAEKKQSTKKFLESLKPGTILSGSWGYDQTNIEFYKILEVRGSKIKLVELGHETIEGSEGFMCCKVKPGGEMGSPIERVVRGQGVRIDTCITLSLWDGRELYKSWYA
jgi:hypothetical protein